MAARPNFPPAYSTGMPPSGAYQNQAMAQRMMRSAYPGRGHANVGQRFQGIYQGRVTDLAKKKVADSKAKLRPKPKRLGDKMLSQRIRDLVPESKTYTDLLTFEQKLDATLTRKKLEIQETLKRPLKQKRKLRLFVSHNFFNLPKPNETDISMDQDSKPTPEWELKIEGRLLDESGARPETRIKGKFSSFLKSVIVELDPNLYGPDQHIIEWSKEGQAADSDGFQIRRIGDCSTKATIILTLHPEPIQYKLPSKLSKLLGVHTATRPIIIRAIWQYITTNSLQDPNEREYINCDKYFEQIFEVPRMKFTELPKRLYPLLGPPDPIVIHHQLNPDAPDSKKLVCYDIDVEVDDPVKSKMQTFVGTPSNQQEISSLDQKILETVEQINTLKLQREFYLGFSQNPQKFINEWLASQSRDLKLLSGNKVGNKEAERKAAYYQEKWVNDGVTRYFYQKVSQRRSELEQALGMRHP